ncbi:DegT/DnrJ/EryC1/StrS aminotransferase family protein [Bacteriovorax sp. BSW11_IV]|uniref:DegT/DnrJ/EryC1/StrS family aminotransferase n=1 Tax=Bacteriovorax sp. BSW11_IV TaxID=1353529 RepID=UPI00038A3FC2|nr:DegT/DnrJ/EryC1/StrS family aminotransferase [Bacteriovorax sp. BSW11_IV]EQC45790.1 DegT/DnrJ/EryC1/StrS aminotransferase family protein [Bacteriovorax sp. BSW11_IV]
MDSYSLASSSWDKEEITAIQRVIDSNMFSMGKEVQNFEKAFSEFTGSKYSVMVNSGSSANLLAVAALFYKKNNPLKRGDEVIVPAVSWSTTYYPLYQYGLKLKFVDIDINTLNYDLDALKSSLTDKTRMIVAVNLLGNPNCFDSINSLMKERNIILIEDNCESMGAKYKGKQAGTFGTMGTFSTFFSHHISTMEGGVINTDDEELYHILLSLRAHGWTRNLPKENLVTGMKSDNPFEESFKFVLPGYNVRPVEMSGAIGIEQLKKLPKFIKERRENAKYFLKQIKEISFLRYQQEIEESSWFGFAIILNKNSPVSRNELVKILIEKNIDCRPIVAGNFAKNDVIKYFDYEIHQDLKNSDYIDKNGFFVGNHQFNIKSEIDLLIRTLKEIDNR